ncbi:MAG: fibronectin type III domain-containing protein [Thermoplasmata archaeon]|nr:fibronectin type III domain-containing protein [Thermoplasmata archaeon]
MSEGGPAPATLAVLVVMVLLCAGLATGRVARDSPASTPATASPASTTVPHAGGGAARAAPHPALAAAMGIILGTVRDIHGLGLGGIEVNLTTNCTLPASESSCTSANSTLTNETGAYVVGGVVPGPNYWVWTNRSTSHAGASAHLGGVANTTTFLNFTAQPFEALSTHDFVLPGWTNLSAFAANSNCDVHTSPCSSGFHVAGQQVPLLSWSQDGVYYVNASHRLVFYSFANASLQSIANWTPLYQNLMNYDGLEDTEWITQDSQYVYTMGRTAPAGTSVTAFWANVTTGRTWEYNFTGIGTSALYDNGQIQLLGEGGNYSIVAVIAANGTVEAYNFWNQTEWPLAKLAFFEANNVYWIPQLDSFLDVQAGGNSADRIIQYRLEGTAPGTTMVPVYSGVFAHSYTSNGVNGLAFNVTARTLAFTYLATSPTFATTVYHLLPDGTLDRQIANYSGGFPLDRSIGSPLPYSVMSSEHRVSVFSWGAAYAGYTDVNFENGSFSDLRDPSPSWVGTNITYDHPAEYKLKAAGGGQWFPSEGLVENSAVEGMFFNTTFGLVEGSVDCRSNGSLCALDGNAYGATTAGTVQYYWRSAGPVFPFAASAGRAERSAPSNVTNVSVTAGTTTLNVSWAPPSDGTNPLLNYTVQWGPSALLGSVQSVAAPNATLLALTGLTPGTTFFFRIQATNLHGTNEGVWFNATTRQIGPAPPTAFVSPSHTFYSITLQWTNPTGALTDNHVYW